MKYLLLILEMLFVLSASAQVGYQVSLLDTKTGEPRANETVSVTIKITDSKGNEVCNQTVSETSDAFGVLSITVGNTGTFTDVNWENLPLKISTTVDGVLIGSSDILTVPVSEYAKHTGVLRPEDIIGKTITPYAPAGFSERYSITFSASSCTVVVRNIYSGMTATLISDYWEIEGNNIYVEYPVEYTADGGFYKLPFIIHYNPQTKMFRGPY